MLSAFDMKKTKNTLLISYIDNCDYESALKEISENKNISINKKCEFGWCILHLAIQKENCPLSLIEKIISYPDFNVNKKDSIGTSYLFEAASAGRIDIVSVLLGVPGIDLDARNHAELTALDVCRIKSRHKIARLINEKKSSMILNNVKIVL